jgi:hypothetical protein
LVAMLASTAKRQATKPMHHVLRHANSARSRPKKALADRLSEALPIPIAFRINTESF